MDATEVKQLIESGIPGADVDVGRPRGVEDDDHLAAVVVSSAFEGKSLLEQHEMVYDALGEAMTNEIHAMELKTLTPDESRG